MDYLSSCPLNLEVIGSTLPWIDTWRPALLSHKGDLVWRAMTSWRETVKLKSIRNSSAIESVIFSSFFLIWKTLTLLKRPSHTKQFECFYYFHAFHSSLLQYHHSFTASDPSLGPLVLSVCLEEEENRLRVILRCVSEVVTTLHVIHYDDTRPSCLVFFSFLFFPPIYQNEGVLNSWHILCFSLSTIPHGSGAGKGISQPHNRIYQIHT